MTPWVSPISLGLPTRNHSIRMGFGRLFAAKSWGINKVYLWLPVPNIIITNCDGLSAWQRPNTSPTERYWDTEILIDWSLKPLTPTTKVTAARQWRSLLRSSGETLRQWYIDRSLTAGWSMAFALAWPQSKMKVDSHSHSHLDSDMSSQAKCRAKPETQSPCVVHGLHF